MLTRFSTEIRREEKIETVLVATQNGQSESSLDDEGIVALRLRLKQLGVWPEAADQILALMPHSRWTITPLAETDYQWVPHVVEDSLKGVDIGAYYPAFFQKLLVSPELRQTFMQMLDSRLAAD